MNWSQRGHDIYIVFKRGVKCQLDFDKVEVSLTDRSCMIITPDGKKHCWNWFLEVNSKESQRIQSSEYLMIILPKKDTTLYWPSFKRIPAFPHLPPTMYSGKNNFNQHNINQQLTQPTINQFTQQEVQQASNTSLKNPKNNLDKLRSNLLCTSSKNSVSTQEKASTSGSYSTQQNSSAGVSSQNSKRFSEERHSDDSELTMGDYNDDNDIDITSSQEEVTSQSSSDGQPPSKMPHYAQANPPEDSKVVINRKQMYLNPGNSTGILMGGNRTRRMETTCMTSSNEVENIENQKSSAPAAEKSVQIDQIKQDFYQREHFVVVELYVPSVSSMKCDFSESSMQLSFKTTDTKVLSLSGAQPCDIIKCKANFSSNICTEESTCLVKEKKIVLKLKKCEPYKKWPYVFVLLNKNLEAGDSTLKIYSFVEENVKKVNVSSGCSSGNLPTRNKPGFTGLDNLGNTCYLNSVVQAIANVQQLKTYFLDGKYKNDINKTSVLGSCGKVAESFCDVVENLWNGKFHSFTPTAFREVIGSRQEGRFNDHNQHDAQEFMAFLLDLLHEDLNRVHVKPYIEMENSEGKSDQQMAQESWKLHRRRDDSKIVDLFHGLYKSTLTCPDCKKASVKFDPFLFLALPLPKLTKPIKVHLQSSDANQLPIQVTCQIPLDGGKAVEIFKKCSSVLKTPASCLRMFEVVGSKFNRFFVPESSIDGLKPNSVIVVQEALLLDEQCGRGYYEVVVLQRKLENHNRTCGYCKKMNDGLKRCTKCLKVAYCNQKCQRAHWSQHKFDCRKTFQHISIPFIIKIPKFKWTFCDLCNYLTQLSISKYVNVEFIENKNNKKLGIGELTSNFNDFPLEFKPFEWNRMSNSSCLTPLHDQGVKIIDFSNIKFLAMDWLSDPNRKVYASISMKNIEYESTAEMKGNENLQLQDCVKLFTEAEILDPEEAWYCPHCKQSKEATKKLSLCSLPEVLIIQLKRFSFKNYLWRDKIDTFVNFPMTGLDMSEHMLEKPDKPIWYDLFAVVNHHGSILGGHYTSYVSSSDGEWRLCDDQNVTKVLENKDVVSNCAYVMFYKLRKTSEENSLDKSDYRVPPHADQTIHRDNVLKYEEVLDARGELLRSDEAKCGDVVFKNDVTNGDDVMDTTSSSLGHELTDIDAID